MAGPFILTGLALMGALMFLLLGGAGQICPAGAREALPSESSPEKYEDLGMDFLRSIGSSLQKSDLYLRGAGKLEMAEQRSGSILPEGEPLLMRAAFGKDGVYAAQDIYTIKKNHRLMISLADFAAAAGLAIKVDAAAGTAAGWFIRENRPFSLDAKKAQVLVAGKVFPVRGPDIDTGGSDLLVSAEALEKWFGIAFDYNLSDLTLRVKTTEPFPIEQAYARQQKTRGRFSDDGKARLPEQAVPYALLSRPYIDTNINAALDHVPGQGPVKSETYSTIFSGDVAGLNAKGYISGSQRQPSDKETFVDSARITLGKEDPGARLLGPLHATSYKIGDIDTVSNTLIGGGQMEQGVSIANTSLDNSTSQTFTQIRGDSQPGWDIELYRNETYMDIRHVGADGRYDFGNVDLVAGDNDFKLLFFGPQGEYREEHRHVGVDAASLSGNKGQYQVSVSRNKRVTWERAPSTLEEAGDPRFSARYEQSIGPLGTGSMGITHNDDGGQYRTFAEAGLASYFLGTFLNLDYGADTGTGAYSARATARRNFGRQSALLQYTTNTKDYNTASPAAGASIKDTYRAALSGPITDRFLFLSRPSYSASAGYVETYNGSTALSLSGSLTAGVRSILFSTTLSYTKNTQTAIGSNIGNFSTGAGNSALNLSFNARGPFMGGVLRTATQYALQPAVKMTQSTMTYDRQLASNLSSTTEIDYVPEPKLTTLSTRLSWQTPYATIGPSARIDSTHNASIGVDVHFGLGPDPYSYKYQIYNAYLAEAGGVSARVFQDNNGNGIFDRGDTLLPDVQLTAIQSGRSAVTDERGVAFIPNLDKNQLTDIVVNPSSSEDAFGISLFKGVAIRPHPGSITRLEFPVVNSGELDGQSHYIDLKGVSRNARDLAIALVTPDGRVEKTASAASDGYWSMSVIKPGIYYLTAQADSSNAGYFLPRLLEYKPDGTTLFGQDVTLSPGYTVNFRFSADNAVPDGANHARVIRPADIATQRIELETGPYHSRLAMMLAWYRIKITGQRVPGGLVLARPMADMPQDTKTGMLSLVLRPNTLASMRQGAEACQILGDLRLGSCTVNVITTYRAPGDEKIEPYDGPAEVVAAETVPDKKTADAEPETAEPIAPIAVAATSASAPAASYYGAVLAEPQDMAPAPATTTTAALSPALAADLADYVAVNPAIDRARLKGRTVLLNLGSYNSRALMTVIWFKLRTRYAGMIGDARLLVRPTDSNASAQTGKYTLRAVLPVFNVEDADHRCALLTAQGQECLVEVLPSGLQASR